MRPLLSLLFIFINLSQNLSEECFKISDGIGDCNIKKLHYDKYNENKNNNLNETTLRISKFIIHTLILHHFLYGGK
jgi:hypothetical protein